MKEHPIIFSGPMARAILDGKKTQTRRLVKPQPPQPEPYGGGLSWSWSEKVGRFLPCGSIGHVPMPMKMGLRCPYGASGDRLWLRESFARVGCKRHGDDVPPEALDASNPCDCRRVIFAADYAGAEEHVSWSWKPSIHMPRWASRITLAIEAIRVERLQDITEEDARAEGAPERAYGVDDAAAFGLRHVAGFAELWDTINGEHASWASNPWVFVVSFRRVLP